MKKLNIMKELFGYAFESDFEFTEIKVEHKEKKKQ